MQSEPNTSARREQLREEFRDQEYREMYADQYVNGSLATQISVLRDQRGLTQTGLAAKIKKQQPAISRIENVNYARWNVSTLRQIANALGCWLSIRFESWGKLVQEAESFNSEFLRRPLFEDDCFLLGSEVLGPLPDEVRQVQKELFPYLDKSTDFRQLIAWLETPVVSNQREPEPGFAVLQQAILAEPSTSPYRARLIDRVNRLLAALREGREHASEEVYVGLFGLMAAFPSAQSWRALLDVYRKGIRDERTLPESTLPTFLAALIRSQRDPSLEARWLMIAAEGRDTWFPTNRFDAFEGLKWMPPRPRIISLLRGLDKLYFSERNGGEEVNFHAVMAGLKSFYRDNLYFPGMLFEAAFYSESSCHPRRQAQDVIVWPTRIVEAWARTFASTPEERHTLLINAPPSLRRVLHAAIGPHLPGGWPDAEMDWMDDLYNGGPSFHFGIPASLGLGVP